MSRPALSAMRISDLGATWARELGAIPAEDQESVLGEADALRTGDADARWRALLAYRALAPRLDGRSAADASRLEWILEEDVAFDGVTRRFAEIASEHPRTDVRLRAALAEGACDVRDGRLSEAERALRRLLPAVRARGDVLEVEAWHRLSRVYAKGRREVEALLTARRADALLACIPAPLPVHVAEVETALAESYACLEDWPRLLFALDRLDAWATRLPAPGAFRVREDGACLRIEAAIGRGDALAARRRLEELEALQAERPRTAPSSHRSLARERARVALAEGRPEAALARLREVEEGEGTARDPVLDLVEVTALKRIGDPSARPLASRLLDALGEAAVGGSLSPGARLRLADGLGRIFEASPPDADLAGRAFRTAADSALARLGEIERAMRDLTDLTDSDGDDREALAGYRLGFWRRHGQVLGALAQALGAAARRGERPPWADFSADGMIAVCAWCRNLRATDGRWLPIGHFVLTVDSLLVTHGMCDPCFERMRGEDG